jgi:hypothetical protein
MSLDKLEIAQRELIELYLRLDLPKHWGDGKTVAADGTQYDFYDNNLLAGYHFRYRKMGAVAYRHVADNYIAVFQHFIPPGVWEAIYVIEGLLKAGLSVKADTVHSDTQGQSAAVFAFTQRSFQLRIRGISLMPSRRCCTGQTTTQDTNTSTEASSLRLRNGLWIPFLPQPIVTAIRRSSKQLPDSSRRVVDGFRRPLWHASLTMLRWVNVDAGARSTRMRRSSITAPPSASWANREQAGTSDSCRPNDARPTGHMRSITK